MKRPSRDDVEFWSLVATIMVLSSIIGGSFVYCLMAAQVHG